ncbi:hypothetical protein [Xanthomonas hortorum]|uniref:Uncharacterized protein n=1 Tax=Xanthomonas hortorum pv. vitians TaxID=83224 RepID=A0A6V7EPM5_9XANT|nr:hypothetical protein [Xanthomonas hortorum]APP85432.1 hypothetical protein BI317_15890 [Xanthomonas hortorum pv. gardneri]MCE4302928.1 hypothetical protein [Xanthomonas hortorum pv. vitians]MCE4311050.1 hypothetical protein [Xanthomonas hortorum pv. vitians]MCE4552565.1 hypothetical protein [Xanthomonas hortorum pv. vitians]MDT7825251.1 hypothetical protein [Xanthomonas hortorum pv. vitians]
MSIQQSAKLISNGDQRVERLTKREEFAKAAMQGLVGSQTEDSYNRLSRAAVMHGMEVHEWIAQSAVKQGDALLAALENQP